jgi:serine phosphatase RsbU (regulator of sigma subunit)/ligand-binding sensor domain-containing protein
MSKVFYILTSCWFTLCCVISFNTFGITNGTTFIKNYSEKEYNAHAQNFYITQDKRGLMYFANNEGVLYFDGIKWESIYLPSLAHFYSVAVNYKGTIYAAGQNEMGYLKSDKQGKLSYISLLTKIKENKRNFSDVFDIVCIDSMVYFLSEERLYIYNQSDFSYIEPSENGIFRALFKVNNKVYVNDKNLGLQELVGTKLVQIKNTEQLGEIRIKSLFELDHRMLACTGQNKFIEILPKSNKVETWFDIPEQNNLIVRTAIKLSNGNICVGSKNNGLIIFNTAGEIVARYNVENGLINNSIWYLYEDFQHNIWVATDKGISFIELSANLEKITSNLLSEVNLNSVINYQNSLYIGTSQSLIKLEKNQNALFEKKISDELEAYHQVLNFEDDQHQSHIIAATDHGIIEVSKEKTNYIDAEGDFPVIHIAQSRFQKNLLFASGIGQIYIYKFENASWKKTMILNIGGLSVNSFAEPQPGILWAGTNNNSYFEINLTANNNIENLIPLTLNLKRNQNPVTRFFYLNQRINVDTDEGIYQYENNKWIKNKDIQGISAESKLAIFRTFDINENKLGALMVNEAGNINCGFFTKKNNEKNYLWIDKFLKRLYNISINSICVINNDLWLASNEGLFYYDLLELNTGNFEYKTLINNIHIPNSTLFFASKKWIGNTTLTAPIIAYKNNQLRFEYTATNYIVSEKIKFSSILIPFDEQYTDWTLERVRSFTNLPEGDYVFKVKSMDIYGNIGIEDEFNFTILPPWYRTWWAYSLFIIVAVISTIGLIKFNTRRLKMQNQLLEATVINRTQEIAEQKNKIEEINREVTDSIRYAQMIQNSILPLSSDLKKTIPESFIFYKPRDIVSGDFYWIHELPDENRILIAAADCTGHGVPGAFMSMMGMEKLNQSVKDIKNINPSAILSYLNKEIKLTLGKHIQERELRDGMEIALIEVNLLTNQINFSGANRPLWVVSPGKEAEDIEIYKPTKAGIAGFTDFEQVFEQTTIQIQKGQTIYLFTDGAIDQFGGPSGKKIMTKGLKNLINSIQLQSLQNQYNEVASFFESWQGQHEQVDDILIIGIKLNEFS